MKIGVESQWGDKKNLNKVNGKKGRKVAEEV